MKIIHIIKGLGLAGAENHLITLLDGLRHHHDIDAQLLLWVTPTQQADDVYQAAIDRQIPVERWTMQGHLDMKLLWRLIRYLRYEKPDAVHTHLVHAETFGIPAARLAGVKTIFNSSHNDDPFRRRLLFRPRNWLLWRMTTQGIAISNYIKQFLLEVETAKPNQIEVIHYGLAAPHLPESNHLRDQLGIAQDAPIIGSVCRLVEQKGLPYALDAMPTLMERYPDLHYVLVGDGILRLELEAQVQSLGIMDRVHFLGWQTDVQTYMRQYDIFLAPSLWEGFGLVFLEAMAQARPIVATNISAIPEIVVDGHTGLLVPPQNTQAITEVLSKLLSNSQMAQTMGQAGRKRLDTDFSVQKMIEQTAALYRRSLS